MSFRKPIFFVVLLAFAGLFQSCQDSCTREQTFSSFTPVWMSLDEIRQDIVFDGPRDLVNPGKLYYYQNYLFINERGEGIHIFDNSNPAFPSPVSFIAIPGNEDIAIKENILFANNYIDLITIDITSPESPSFVKRSEEVFPAFSSIQDGQILVDYTEETVTMVTDCDEWGFFMNDVFRPAANEASMMADMAAVGVGGTGVGGSMARFTIVEDYLYTVDDNNLNSFDISNLTDAMPASTVNIGWGIETVYPAQGHLFIGSSTGMFIYGLDNPAEPNFKGDFNHANACDPVVVKDNYAYVTLRSGTECEGFINQMDVVNIENLFNPFLEQTFAMHNPHGLSISDNHLFLCEGDQGLKVFDISDPLTLDERMIDHQTNLHGFDVLTLADNLVLVVGKDGLYQFDSSDPSDLKQISVIPVIK
ncbi:MAG: hypothetical protein AAFV80_22060 [Bacteroidota bacterium]